jgi:hypothetical protein
MKKLVLGSLVAGLAFAAGCTVEEDAHVVVSWPLTSGVDSTPGAACPVGAVSARVTFSSQSGDIESLFFCDDGSGAEFVPPDDYIVTVDLMDGALDPTIIYAGSFAYNLSVGSGDEASVTAPINVNSGFFDMTWDFSPAGEDCATLGADGVDMIASIADDAFALDTILNCTDRGGRTDGVPLDDRGYVIQVSLLDGDVVLGSSQPRPMPPFEFANAVQDAGNFTFAVSKPSAGR